MLTPGEIARRKHEYYLKNKDIYLQRAKQWKLNHPEKYKECVARSQKKYLQKNKEVIREKVRQRNRKKAVASPPRKLLTAEEKKERAIISNKKYQQSQKGKINRRQQYIKSLEKKKSDPKTRYKSQMKSAGEILNEMKSGLLQAPPAKTEEAPL